MSRPLIRILIADRFDVVRRGVRLLVESRDYCRVVGEARSGREALGLVRETHPHIVIADYSLPELNGLDLAHEVRRASPATELLIYSGNNQEDFVDIYLTVGATAVSKVATVASDVVSFVHNAVGMGAGAQLCYQVQAGNNVGLSSFSNIACATTPAIVFVTAPNSPANLVVQ